MKQKFSSGQALVEYGFLLVLVVLAVLAVLAVTSPAIGGVFHSAVDDTVNSDVRSVGYRVTMTVLAATVGTGTPGPGSTPVPPSLTPVPPTVTSVPPTLTSVPPTFTATPDWVFCANENGTCSFSGSMEVRYGASGYYYYRVISGGTPCTNAVFGDPVVGVGKKCYIRPVSATATPTATSTNTATATSTSTNTPTATQTATQTPVPATATSTPIPSTATFTNTPTATATATPAGPWTLCANENGTCSFLVVPPVIVRYGTGSSFAYKTITGNSTPCTNAVFGDPAYGYGKQCWYQGNPPPNSIVSVTADRNSSNRNKVDVFITLANAIGSTVDVLDNQSGVTGSKSCSTTCTVTLTIGRSNSSAGTVVVSGVDFGVQTITASYPRK